MEKVVSTMVLPVLVQILGEPLSRATPHLKDSCQRLSGALTLLTGQNPCFIFVLVALCNQEHNFCGQSLCLGLF
jgi:hypothetical protein